MKHLDLFSSFECLGLIVWSFLNSFKSGRLKPKQDLDAVKDDLPFCHVSVSPEWLTLVVDGLRLGGVDIVDVPSELPQQIQWLSEAWFLGIDRVPTLMIRLQSLSLCLKVRLLV